MSFARYPAYKDSGVEWLGEVPEHWEVKRLKLIASHNDETLDESTDADFEILYVDISSVDPMLGITAKEAMLFSAAPSRARRKVRNGDAIVSTVRTYLRAIARITNPEDNLIVSTGFAVVRPSPQVHHSFLGYLLTAGFFVDEVISRSVGVSYPAINASDLMRIAVPLPKYNEQQAIATFLDIETAKIDGLMAEQRALVALLKEKRQAVISHAVTKGLNPAAPMKDSSVAWLGEVPGHWVVTKIRRLCEIKKRIVGELGFDVLSITQKGIRIKDLEGNHGQISMDYSKYQLVEPGDFAMNHMDLLTGYVDIAKTIGVTSPDYRVFRIKNKSVSNDKYLLYLFQNGYQSQLFYPFGRGSSELGRWRLPTDEFNNFPFPLPPLKEQEEIAAFIAGQLIKFDTLTQEAQTAIALLQERRTALISAAVTGKMDVRAA